MALKSLKKTRLGSYNNAEQFCLSRVNWAVCDALNRCAGCFYLESVDVVLWWEGHPQSTGLHTGTRWCCPRRSQCSSAGRRRRGPAEECLSLRCPALSSLPQEKIFSQRHLQETLVDPRIFILGGLRLRHVDGSRPRSPARAWMLNYIC